MRQRLDNGLVVLAKENPASPLVALTGTVAAGTMHEDDSSPAWPA